MADSQGNGAPEAPQGTAAPEAGQGTENKAPAGITLEDVNKAITARNRDFEKKLEAKLTDLTGGLSKSIEAKLAELLAPKGADAGDDAGGDGKGKGAEAKGGDKAPAKDPEVIALKSEMTKLRNQMAESEKRASQEAAKRLEVEMRQAVVEKLAAYGINGARAKHALGYLVDVTKSVSRDETGAVVFRQGPDEAVELESGLKAWAASEDAKIYMPPRGVAGSGDATRGGGHGPGAGPKDANAELTQLIGKAFGIGG